MRVESGIVWIDGEEDDRWLTGVIGIFKIKSSEDGIEREEQ